MLGVTNISYKNKETVMYYPLIYPTKKSNN